MPNLTIFTKKEVLTFIDLFEQNTTKLKEPMISWVGDGAYELDKARKMVEDGFIPEGVVMCAQGLTGVMHESVFIAKDDNGEYELSTGDMPRSMGDNATDINSTLIAAQELLLEYINLG